MVKILNCYLNAKKSYGTLSKSAIVFDQPCIYSKRGAIKSISKENLPLSSIETKTFLLMKIRPR